MLECFVCVFTKWQSGYVRHVLSAYHKMAMSGYVRHVVVVVVVFFVVVVCLFLGWGAEGDSL